MSFSSSGGLQYMSCVVDIFVSIFSWKIKIQIIASLLIIHSHVTLSSHFNLNPACVIGICGLEF